MKQDVNQPKEELSLENNESTELVELIGDLTEELPAEKKEQIDRLLVSQSYSGPLPPPVHIEGYNNAIPNGGERLMRMVEKEAEQSLQERSHRMDMEAKIITNRIRQTYLGFTLAFLLAIVIIGSSVFLALQGFNIPAAMLTGAFALAAIFITRKNATSKNLEEKS